MNSFKMLLILSALFLASFSVKAEGKFCVITNGGQSCSYYDVASCQRAASASGGICSANQEPQKPPVMFNPAGSYDEGYNAGAEAGRRLRAAREAQREATVNYLPPPTTFVEKCRALVAMDEGTAQNLYGTGNISGVSFRAGTCFGYISGYINAFKQRAQGAGKSCSIPSDAYAVAKQIAALTDETITSSTLGLPALLYVSQSWHCD